MVRPPIVACTAPLNGGEPSHGASLDRLVGSVPYLKTQALIGAPPLATSRSTLPLTVAVVAVTSAPSVVTSGMVMLPVRMKASTRPVFAT